MRSMRRLALALLVGALLSVATSDAAAATAAQSCDGQVIALMNQASGASGPSDNPQAAAGPGHSVRSGNSALRRRVGRA